MEEIKNEDSIKVSYEVAENFDSLYEMIKMVNHDDTKASEDLIMLIEDVRAGERPLSDIPEDFDLRATVEKLLASEPK